MSIRSLADFMEESLRSERRLASTATVTGRRGPQVDASAKGADIWWPELLTSHGHRCGLLTAISADFLVATDMITDPDRMFAESDYLISVLESVEGRSAPTLGCPPGEPKWKLVVAEDADPYLRSTARFDAGAALGRLLNATDGLLGQSTKTLILLTTNEELTRLQPALIRPGRCLTRIEFDHFSGQEAGTWLGDGWRDPVGAAMLAELFEAKRTGQACSRFEKPLGPTCDFRRWSGLPPIRAMATVAPFVPAPENHSHLQCGGSSTSRLGRRAKEE